MCSKNAKVRCIDSDSLACPWVHVPQKKGAIQVLFAAYGTRQLPGVEVRWAQRSVAAVHTDDIEVMCGIARRDIFAGLNLVIEAKKHGAMVNIEVC